MGYIFTNNHTQRVNYCKYNKVHNLVGENIRLKLIENNHLEIHMTS